MKVFRNKGFTLAELLIVVAIIGVLVAISIPIFTTQLEKSRDAASIANIRSAYSRAMNEYITCTITDSRMDGEVHSHSIKDNEKAIGTVNFRNGRIIQVCIVNVKLLSKSRNSWSGMADVLPFYDHMNPDNDSHGDSGVPKNAMLVFNFDDSGAGHSAGGSNWDGYDVNGMVTSVWITDSPEITW